MSNVRKDVQVGEWVRSEVTNKEGLVIDWNPLSQFFTIEAEDGTLWTDQRDFLYVVD